MATTALTAQQHKGLEDIMSTVRDAQKTGAITYSALHDVCIDTAHTLNDDALKACFELVWAEYEKDQTLGLLRAVLSALSIVHYKRLYAAHQDTDTAELFRLWETDTADEMADPLRPERDLANVCSRTLSDRVIANLGDDAGDEALNKVIDDFPDGEKGEALADRLKRYKAHEIAALRVLLAA